MPLCSRICWFEDNSSRIDQPTEHEVMSHCEKSMNTLDIFFLHCYTASISMHFNNCWSFERRMAKISLIQFVLRRTTATTALSRSSTATELSLYLSTTKACSRWRVQGLHWSPTSGDNIQVRIRRPDNIAIVLWTAGGRCQYSRMPLLASPVAADIIITYMFLTKCVLFLQRMAAFKFKRARRVQAGRPGAGRNKAVAPNIIWT